MGEAPSSRGLYSSLRGLLATGVAVVRNRLDLLSTELQEEKSRLLGLLAYGAVALIFLSAGLIFLAVFLTVLLWDSHRLLVLGVCSTLFLGGGAVAFFAARQAAQTGSRLFAASLSELEQDGARLERGE